MRNPRADQRALHPVKVDILNDPVDKVLLYPNASHSFCVTSVDTHVVASNEDTRLKCRSLIYSGEGRLSVHLALYKAVTIGDLMTEAFEMSVVCD